MGPYCKFCDNAEGDPTDHDDEQITAWHKVATHPAFKLCHRDEGTLIDAMLKRLTVLMETEAAATELVASELGTVTLPRNSAKWAQELLRRAAQDWRERGYAHTAVEYDAAAIPLDDALDAANTPPAPTSAPTAASEADLAPEGGQGAERAAGGRVCVEREDVARFLRFTDDVNDWPAYDRLRAALDAGVGK